MTRTSHEKRRIVSTVIHCASPAQLALFMVLGVLTGIAAGIRPARRAARMNALTAIAPASLQSLTRTLCLQFWLL